MIRSVIRGTSLLRGFIGRFSEVTATRYWSFQISLFIFSLVFVKRDCKTENRSMYHLRGLERAASAVKCPGVPHTRINYKTKKKNSNKPNVSRNRLHITDKVCHRYVRGTFYGFCSHSKCPAPDRKIDISRHRSARFSGRLRPARTIFFSTSSENRTICLSSGGERTAVDNNYYCVVY